MTETQNWDAALEELMAEYELVGREVAQIESGLEEFLAQYYATVGQYFEALYSHANTSPVPHSSIVVDANRSGATSAFSPKMPKMPVMDANIEAPKLAKAQKSVAGKAQRKAVQRVSSALEERPTTLKALYRQLAKRFHPDSVQASEQDKALFAEIADAYHQGSEMRLKRIYHRAMIRSIREESHGEETLEAYYHQLRQALKELLTYRSTLTAKPEYQLMRKSIKAGMMGVDLVETIRQTAESRVKEEQTGPADRLVESE